jgi:hypothetical protein
MKKLSIAIITLLVCLTALCQTRINYISNNTNITAIAGEPIRIFNDSGRMLFIPSTLHAGFIAGSANNYINPSNSIRGATILGGDANTIQGISSSYSTISGGRFNEVTNSQNAAIAGGSSCTVGTEADFGAIGGGSANQIAAGDYSVISGGRNNIISNTYSAILGGRLNYVEPQYSVVVGGQNNIIQKWVAGGAAGKDYSSIVGGALNMISRDGPLVNYDHGLFAPGYLSVIGGGGYNFIAAPVATICGGGDNTNRAAGACMVGGDLCYLGVGATRSFQGGGAYNRIDNSTHTVLCGGYENTITNSSYSSLVGGRGNEITNAQYSFIGAGSQCVILADDVNNSDYSAIVGGLDQIITNAVSAVISGGEGNVVSNCYYGTIPGGYLNHVQGNGSMASGVQAITEDNYCFVWNDGGGEYSTTGDNQFRASAAGQFYFDDGIVNIEEGIVMPKNLAVRALDITAMDNVWDDLRYEASVLGPPGSGSLLGTSGQSGDQLALEMNDTPSPESFFVNVQMPHTWIAGTTIYPHIHVEPQTANANNTTWTVNYSISDINGTFPADTSAAGQTANIGAGNQWKHLIFNLPNAGISMAGKAGPSTIVRMKFTVTAADEALHVLSFDVHFRCGGTPVPYTP